MFSTYPFNHVAFLMDIYGVMLKQLGIFGCNCKQSVCLAELVTVE